MKNLFFQLVRLIFFWLFTFLLFRLIFLASNTHLLASVNWDTLLKSLYKGLRLDLSMIGYLLIVPFLLAFWYYCSPKKYLKKAVDYVVVFHSILYTITAVGELCLYREWRSKLSVQALQHLSNPSEVFKTASWQLTVLFFFLSIGFIVVLIFLYKKYVSAERYYPKIEEPIKSRLTKGFFAFWLGAFLLVLAIRGGLQAIPIQSSDPYFSSSTLANDVAVNPLWSIMFNLFEHANHFNTNPFVVMDQNVAEAIVAKAFKVDNDSSLRILTNVSPNIVVILLEGWSTSCIGSFGGDDFAPFFDSLSRQGIRFTSFYPPAYTSDQGIPAVISAYPATSRISIISQSSKSARLPSLNKDLKKRGYSSGFTFGGDLNYGNIRSYLYNVGFDQILEEETIDATIPRGKLGIQDKEMAEVFLTQINQAKAPFLQVWFTSSTHMPYDFEAQHRPMVDHKENNYVNSIRYADEALKTFFANAKRQPWYANTLFVLVSDHSHASHKDHNVYDAEYHRIPLVLVGDVIDSKAKGMEVTKTFSQLDITPTLLNQLGLKEEAKQYPWSRDMFNPRVTSFAYYCSFNGGGVVSGESVVGFQHGYDSLIVDRTNNDLCVRDSLFTLGKAFQQVFFEDYRLK